MSCMVLTPAHIAAVAHGLAFMLNGSAGMCQLSAPPELFDALTACRYDPHGRMFDDRTIYAALYRHNDAAYEGRYMVEVDELDSIPAMPNDFPRLLHPLRYHERYLLDHDFYQYIMLLDCFIYQCEEDATARTDLQKALSETRRCLYSFAVQQNAEYASCSWCI